MDFAKSFLPSFAQDRVPRSLYSMEFSAFGRVSFPRGLLDCNMSSCLEIREVIF